MLTSLPAGETLFVSAGWGFAHACQGHWGLPGSELGLAIRPQGFLGWEEQPGQADISQLLTRMPTPL